MAKQDFYQKNASDKGRSDAHTGRVSTTVDDPTQASGLITMWWNQEPQRDMTSDEKTIYAVSRADELNRIATSTPRED